MMPEEFFNDVRGWVILFSEQSQQCSGEGRETHQTSQGEKKGNRETHGDGE
jgi:hypothetical protein